MPTRKLKLTRAEEAVFRASISRSKEIGALPEFAGGHPYVPKSLRLHPLQTEDAEVWELPSGEVAAILPIEIMRPLRPRAWIVGCQIVLPWEGPEFELQDPEHNGIYSHLKQRLYPERLLNRWLTDQIPLPDRKLQGYIVGYSWIQIPPEYPNEMPVSVKLMVTDDRKAEYYLDFAAHLDRSLKLSYERKRQARAQLFNPAHRTGLYGPARSEYRDRSVAVKSKDMGKDLASSGAGNLKGKQRTIC